MGGFTEHRNFLFNLFGEAFAEHLPDEQSFDVLIMDLMQFIARVKYEQQPHKDGDDCLDAADVAQSARRIVEWYMNAEQAAGRPRTNDLVVVLLDTPEQVPKNKVTTQKSRDQDVLGSVVMDEADYERYATLYDLEAIDHLMVSPRYLCPFSGNKVWRSVNLRQQLYKVVTHELLQIALPPDRLLMLDDGLAIADEVYASQRARMVTDYHFTERTGFEQTCLVSTLVSHFFVQRLLLYPDGHFKRLPASGIGEADVKLCRYVTRSETRRTHLVVSQDTDVIFILLLHMKRLINPQTGRLDDNLEVWIDTQTPSSRSAKQSFPYRYVNVKRLYYALLDLFAREFPAVLHPIETYVFLVHALETDFTAALHPYLKVSDARVWNAFAHLHSGRADGTYLAFNDKIKVESVVKKPRVSAFKVEQFLAPHLRNVLAEAVRCEARHDEQTQDLYYESQVDDESVARFMHALCQIQLKSDLIAMGNAALCREPSFYIPLDQALALACEIEQRVATLRLGKQRQAEKVVLSLSMGGHQTKKSLLRCSSPVINKPVPLRLSETVQEAKMDDIEDIEEDTVAQVRRSHIAMLPSSAIQQARLAKLAEAKTVIPPRYGMPTEEQMLARVRRQHWLLRYSQNGWVNMRYALNFGEPSPLDPARCVWGWRLGEVPQTKQNFINGEMNSGYLLHEFYDHKPGENLVPVRVFRVEECDSLARL